MESGEDSAGESSTSPLRPDSASPHPQPAERPAGAPDTAVDPLLQSPRDPAEVLELAQGAFGPMVTTSLTSPKWDRRAEALKGVEQMLKAARLPGGAANQQQRLLLVAARILEQALRDKVWPVLAGAFSLYKVVLDHSVCLSEQDREAAVKALLPVIAARLGDSNGKINEGASAAVVATASAVAPRVCVAVLVASLQSEAGAKGDKAVAARLTGGLACMQRLARDLGCTEALEAAAPVLQIALDHPKEKVRQLGLDVLADLRRADADLPTLKLRPALEDALQARLMELEDGDDDGEGQCFDAPDFVVVGTKAPVVREAPAAPKPALDFEDEEEALMDNILGDTGLAFQNTGELNLAKGELVGRHNALGLGDVDALEAEFLRDLEGLTSP